MTHICSRSPTLPLVLGFLVLSGGAAALPAQEVDYQVYTDPPRLLLNQRRLRLLKRERERESLRWQQFDALMRGKALMGEPGFALALYGTVTGRTEPCRDAAAWVLHSADVRRPADLRQAAVVYDWCQSSVDAAQPALIARRLSPLLKERPTGASSIRSHLMAALAIADVEPQAAQDFLKYVVENWWKTGILPRLQAGSNPFPLREDLYAMLEILHLIRDNLRVDLREGASRWFEELPALQLLAYYPQAWPAPENEYRIPAYFGQGNPDFREAVFSRSAEMSLVAFDANAQSYQYLQGWVMQDRFLMRSPFGTPYEFLWANPYQPGLSYTYMPDLYHARGEVFVRSDWDEKATWFGFWNGQAQSFAAGRRATIRLDGGSPPLTLGAVAVFFAPGGLRFQTGWSPPAEEGSRPVYDVAFVLGLTPNARYDVEVDDEEMFEARSDSGGILELRFTSGHKSGVRIHKVTL